MTIKESLQKLTQHLKEERIPVILIGGMALYKYGVERLTTDIDFLLSDQDVERIGRVMKEEGFKEFLSAASFSRFESDAVNLKAVDFVFVDSETFKAIEKTSGKAIFSGIEFLVPSLNHLIALKLHAIKNNPARKAKDLGDIVALIKKNEINLESSEITDLFKKYGPSDILKTLKDLLPS